MVKTLIREIGAAVIMLAAMTVNASAQMPRACEPGSPFLEWVEIGTVVNNMDPSCPSGESTAPVFRMYDGLYDQWCNEQTTGPSECVPGCPEGCFPQARTIPPGILMQAAYRRELANARQGAKCYEASLSRKHKKKRQPRKPSAKGSADA